MPREPDDDESASDEEPEEVLDDGRERGGSYVGAGGRMYESKFPEIDDLVMVQVRSIAEMGAYVALMEYDNIEGMILLSELSRRRIRSINKLIRVGKNEVLFPFSVHGMLGW